MYHYFIYILHCGFLFWVFQFLWFLSRSTAVKSKPDSLPHSPNKHITVKTASALVTQVKICSQDERFTSFQPSLVQSFLCYKQLYTESYGEKPVGTNPKSLFLQNNIAKKIAVDKIKLPQPQHVKWHHTIKYVHHFFFVCIVVFMPRLKDFQDSCDVQANGGKLKN